MGRKRHSQETIIVMVWMRNAPPHWLRYLKLRVLFGEAMLADLLEEVHH